ARGVGEEVRPPRVAFAHRYPAGFSHEGVVYVLIEEVPRTRPAPRDAGVGSAEQPWRRHAERVGPRLPPVHVGEFPEDAVTEEVLLRDLELLEVRPLVVRRADVHFR